MSKVPNISNAEWEVMTALWQTEEPIGLNEIIERLPDEMSSNPKTIGTYLNRLTAKKVVSARKVGRTHLYSAVVDREACIKSKSKDFVQRIFGGATAPLMASLIEETDLSEEEIDRLQKLLRKKKGKQS